MRISYHMMTARVTSKGWKKRARVGPKASLRQYQLVIFLEKERLKGVGLPFGMLVGIKNVVWGLSRREDVIRIWRRLVHSPASRYEYFKLELPRAWEPSDSS
jgi:hypothetical protein